MLLLRAKAHIYLTNKYTYNRVEMNLEIDFFSILNLF